MRLWEHEDCVIMRLLRNREVDGMRQCYRKSFKEVTSESLENREKIFPR